MKHTAAALLALVFLLSLAPCAFAVAADDELPSFADAVELDSAEAFLLFSAACSRDVYSKDRVFRLTADIDLSSSDFSGVPYFAGIFLGDGHRILGVSLTADGSRQGLFRRVAEGAVVRDVNVNGKIAPGGTRALIGGIAGVNAGKLLNCSFTGTVEGLEYVGGIAGMNEASGLIDRCVFSGSVSGEHQVGGVAGEKAGVVSRSDNTGKVNTEPIVPQSEKHFDLALLSEDDFLDLANIGGVVGNNTGVISACRNSGAVGYKNTAYNVGGVTGKTSGYVTGCENSASVNGRRDVGGIAGQLIPYVRWDFTNDKLEALSGQLGSLNYLIHKATQHADENTDALTGELARINGYTATAIGELGKVAQGLEINSTRIRDSIHVDPATGTVTVDPISLSAVNTSTLTSVLTDINAEASVVSGLLRSSFDDLTEDMTKILRQMTGIMGGMAALLSNTGGGELYEQVDLSADESYDHDLGAVADCVNYGEIRAENNAGGVIGTIGFEVSFDMEDSLDASQFLTADASQIIFAVARGCRSHCEIHTKNDHAGGVIGEMAAGAAVDCVGTGAAESTNGDYVGGIVGQSRSTIRGCWSRAVLSGGKYVGGVAGLGVDIGACRSWTYIERATEYAGAVAGWAEGEISGNLYAESSPAGIDNVSFSGMTDPVSQEELLALDGLPDNFNDLIVRFMVGEKTLAEIDVPFGGSIEALPEVENDGARYWKWDDFNRDHIYHNMVVEGKYYAPGTTLSSGEEIPLFLVEGVFYEGQTLTAVPYPVSDEDEDVLAAYTLFVDGYEGELTVHMLSAEHGRLYIVGPDGERSAAPSRADGQYVLFTLENGGSFIFVSAPTIADHRAWIAAGFGALAVVAFALILHRRKKKRSADAAAAESESAT